MVLTAYYAVAIAEEAHFAVTGSYTDSYPELRSKGGLATDPTVCYGAIQLYTVDRTGASGMRFAVGHGDRDSFRGAYAYDSTATGDTLTRISNAFDCKLFGGGWEPGPGPMARDNPGVAEADADVQSAFRSVATAQEAHFAEKGVFSGSYDDLRSVAGLLADPSICYGAVDTYVLKDGTAGFRFKVGHAGLNGIPVAYAYDSEAPWGAVARTPNNFACLPFGGGKVEETQPASGNPDQDEAESLMQAAYHSLAVAQEAFFARNGTYTESYDELRETGGLVPDQSVCYGTMEAYGSGIGLPAYRFKLGHAARVNFPLAYSYDSAAAENPAKIPNR
jgi:hypothetical protein